MSQSPIISKGFPTSQSSGKQKVFKKGICLVLYVPAQKENKYKTPKNGQTVKQNKIYNHLVTLLEIVHKTHFLEISKIGEEC